LKKLRTTVALLIQLNLVISRALRKSRDGRS